MNTNTTAANQDTTADINDLRRAIYIADMTADGDGLRRAIHMVDAGGGFSKMKMYVGKMPVGPKGGTCGNVVDGTLVATGTACRSAEVAAMSNADLLAYPEIITGRTKIVH
jgi:hypothetical protein